MALPFFAMMYNLLHERREVAVEENCRSGTDDVGSAPLVLLALHRMKTLCGSGSWPPWETLAVGAGTRSDAPMGVEGRWEDLLLPGTRSHPRYFYKKKQCQQQTAKSEGTRLDASMEGRGC